MSRLGWGVALATLAACADKKPEPLKSLAPRPLPALTPAAGLDAGADRGATYRVELARVYGEELPAKARRLALDGEVDSDALDLAPGATVLVVPSAEVYLVQAAAVLARLDDAGAEVYLAHPEGSVAYRLELRDEPAFRAWLDEPKPGKVRVIQRQDGFELQTNVGKLAGVDPNGPTVPLRGGAADLATLRRGLGRLKERFTTSPDLCFVPSFGTELAAVAAAMSADYSAPGKPLFEELCLVYPRPISGDR